MAKSKTKAAPAATAHTGIHIGISEKDRGTIAEGLSRLLADTYTPVSYTHLTLPTNREV